MLKVTREEAEAWCKEQHKLSGNLPRSGSGDYYAKTDNGGFLNAVSLGHSAQPKCRDDCFNWLHLLHTLLIKPNLHTEKHAEMDVYDTFELFTVKHMYFEVVY